MDINRAIEDIETILKSMELNHKFNVILYEDDKEAFETIVRYFKENSIPKQKVKENIEKLKDRISENFVNQKDKAYFDIAGVNYLLDKLEKILEE